MDGAVKWPSGTRFLVGTPGRAPDSAIARAIARAAWRIQGVIEVHVPEVWVKGLLDPPEPVIVVIIKPEVSLESVADQLNDVLAGQVPPLGVIIATSDEAVVGDVRAAGCSLPRPVSIDRWLRRFLRVT